MERQELNSSDEAAMWEEFDNYPINLQQKLVKLSKKNKKEDKSLNNPPKIEHKTMILSSELHKLNSEYRVEKLNKTLERIRQANEEGVKQIKIVIHNQTKKELKGTMMNIHRQFQQEFYMLKKDKESMFEELSAKIRAFNTLAEYFVHQNFIEEEYSICDFESLGKDSFEEEKERIKELKKLIDLANIRFEAIKTLNTAYKEEAADALKRVDNVNEEINKIRVTHNLAKKNLENIIGNREKEVLNDVQIIRSEYEDFKNRIMQEMHLRTLLEERQKLFIKNLYGELKNAKTILQNPTLRMKTYEKIRETLTPTPVEPNLPKILPSQLSTKDGDSRPVYSPFEPLSNRSTKSHRRTKSSFKP
ncbi:hypothetical protein SteCoe_32750 [Stentor coeruleus]|uniref:Uncharacterized protein n=1 Tax=Stentor coeruleus TaxID=5963 RepID=A0A1R2AYB6_9CILI|nr:hypothetical protein SteCoe_32750 [Stentor coeruleus]